MNILILTPTNEIDAILFGKKLYNDYDENVHLFSLQHLALLANEQEKQKDSNYTNNWHMFEYAMGLATREDDNILRNKAKEDKKPYIIFGNIPKNTIKFDHIITITESSWDWDIEAADRARYDKIFNPTTIEMKYKPLEWYTIDDVQLTLPTYHHLQLFLKTLNIGGVKVGK